MIARVSGGGGDGQIGRFEERGRLGLAPVVGVFVVVRTAESLRTRVADLIPLGTLNGAIHKYE